MTDVSKHALIKPRREQWAMMAFSHGFAYSSLQPQRLITQRLWLKIEILEKKVLSCFGVLIQFAGHN